MDTIFQFSALLVLPFWLLMILVPHWQWTRRIMGSLLVIFPAALLYLGLLLFNTSTVLEFLSVLRNPTLSNVAPVLGSDVGVTIAWIHFGAFDLFVGRWIYLDSRERTLTAWLVSPILLVVFMFGPFGFLLYMLLRWLSSSQGGQ